MAKNPEHTPNSRRSEMRAAAYAFGLIQSNDMTDLSVTVDGDTRLLRMEIQKQLTEDEAGQLIDMFNTKAFEGSDDA